LLFDSKSLTERMRRDYSTGSVPNLSEHMIVSGRFCALSVPESSSFKRACVYSHDKKTNGVCVYLIDSGKFCDTTPDKLFNLLRAYYNIEPLCFECTFDVKFGKESGQQLNERFKELGRFFTFVSLILKD